ncbi:unnamed protein product [Psylliodes chrysocephalus]|uniref:Uncharacterized protein n=1 Tax=Psylliodes chrysocephalus TaxID=3402493 RepID=A0A9P0GFI6_9CUCU|nr:unnamed protein product [Psylliodes chrysocephala]
MEEPSGPSRTRYETLYSRRVRERITAASKPPTVNKVLTNLVKDTNSNQTATENQATPEHQNPIPDSHQISVQTAEKYETAENEQKKYREQETRKFGESGLQSKQPPSDSTHDEINDLQSSQYSFDGPRADANNESMEKPIKTLECSHSGSSSPNTDNSFEFHIDEHDSDTDTPDTIKN